MPSQRYVIERFCAAHCSYQGSNKDWVGVLVHMIDIEAGRAANETPEAQTWMFLSIYGKSGGNLQGGVLPTPNTRAEAEATFEAKVKEKLHKHHYTEVPFAPFLSAFRVPLVMPDTKASAACENNGKESPPPEDTSLSRQGYTSNRVEAISSWQRYTSASYGATEKADGERCILSFDGQQAIQGYNRNGDLSTTVPVSAYALASLSLPFVLDGERLIGGQEGQYVVFDVLHWNGEDIRSWPYRQRIATLQQAFKQADLLKEMLPTPTLGKALQNSLIAGLMLLTPVKGAENMGRLVHLIGQRAGEGIILRHLEAAYTTPKAVLKFKFTADLDAVVIGIKPGKGGGSLKMGLRRPTDNAVIACGHVRSGLTHQDMQFITSLLAQGMLPVMKVEYLPKRTVGIAVVEGRTSREWIRTDKHPWSCTTDQLGEEKALLIAHARAIPDLSFPPHDHA